MSFNIAVLPGDGIGPEIVGQAVRVLRALRSDGLSLEFEDALIGGAAYRAVGKPLPEETLSLAKASSAILFGAVGDFTLDNLPRELRPDRGGILRLRQELGLYANLRPIKLFPQLAAASTLKPEAIAGLDLLIVRELSSDVYFGQPRGIRVLEDGPWKGQREGFDMMRYAEGEVRRIVELAVRFARGRGKRLCSVDKSNVLETMEVWKQTAAEVAAANPDIDFKTMYVDNAGMQLVRAPTQFDVMVMGNLFGDILSDVGAMLTGSIGMLPSASMGDGTRGLYEPIHGSAPDIAGRNVANPLATILSAAMLLRESLNQPEAALRIENAVHAVLDLGLRTGDIASPGTTIVGTTQMGDAVLAELAKQ
jgi:3-isopropylmalate dehydrogenase